jgi:hypothetical protein
MYTETTGATEDRSEDQHLATAYHDQLKTGPKILGESLQQFVTDIEQLTHSAPSALPENHVVEKQA